jgi:hypothetical protein
MEIGVHGLPGLPVARPAAMVIKPEHVSVTAQLQLMVEQTVSAALLKLKLAIFKLAQQVYLYIIYQRACNIKLFWPH